jgi:hypothetical protein
MIHLEIFLDTILQSVMAVMMVDMVALILRAAHHAALVRLPEEWHMKVSVLVC